MSFPAEPSPSNLDNDQPQPPANDEPQQQQQRKKEIKTFHCRYCSHLLLASTRSILSETNPLPRRGGGAGDRALILDVSIPSSRKSASASNKSGSGNQEEQDTAVGGKTDKSSIQPREKDVKDDDERGKEEEEEEEDAHYTIPLSTLIPDGKPVVIRRDDGFEKRVLFKCGRCRVVVGYEIVLSSKSATTTQQQADEDDEGKVMYLLPGSLVSTDDLQGESTVVKQMDTEWARWITV